MSLKIKKLRKFRITQLGEFTEGPSHPIWATCFTSVGHPICISCSFSLSAYVTPYLNNSRFLNK
jgi:hypothetical protein